MSSDHSSSVKRKRSLKQQLRDTRRLLSQDGLPETVRQTKQRVFDMLTEEVKEKEKCEREKKINKKYKMIKFFEKRKIVRRLRSLHNQLKTTTDEERETIVTEIEKLRGDLNYVTYYPNGEKYIALNPTSSETSQKALKIKNKIYQDILSKVDNGLLSDAMEECITNNNHHKPSLHSKDKHSLHSKAKPSLSLKDKQDRNETQHFTKDSLIVTEKVKQSKRKATNDVMFTEEENDQQLITSQKKLKSDPFFMSSLS